MPHSGMNGLIDYLPISGCEYPKAKEAFHVESPSTYLQGRLGNGTRHSVTCRLLCEGYSIYFSLNALDNVFLFHQPGHIHHRNLLTAYSCKAWELPEWKRMATPLVLSAHQ